MATPNQIFKGLQRNKQRITRKPLVYDVGDFVRLKRKKGIFDKGDALQFSSDVYKIIGKDKNRYIIADLQGDKLRRNFKSEEITKVLFTENKNLDEVVDSNKRENQAKKLQKDLKRLGIKADNILKTRRR